MASRLSPLAGQPAPADSLIDVDALPKDIRTSVDIVERFGPAAIVKRRGQSICDEAR